MSEMHFPLQTLTGRVHTLSPARDEQYVMDRFITKRGFDPQEFFAIRARFELDGALDSESGLYFAVSNPNAEVDRERIYLEHLFAAKASTVSFRGITGLTRSELEEAADRGVMQWVASAEVHQNEGGPLVLDYRHKCRFLLDTQGELYLRHRPNGLPYSVKLPWGYEPLWHVRYLVLQPTEELEIHYPEIIPSGLESQSELEAA